MRAVYNQLSAMRNLLRILFRVLVLATVFVGSALLAMRLAIHGREVAVPKVAGMSMSDAERTAISDGLLIEVENRFYSSDVQENRVLSQLPPAGEKVRRGTHLRVALSLGPQKIVIPSVIGQSQRAAEINIGRRGLQIGSVAVATLPGFPPDQIVAQSPPPNAAGVASPKVNLLVSAPQDDTALYLVPDFTGHTLDDASRAIAASPMKFGKVTTVKNVTNTNVERRPAAKGSPVIVRQTPSAGEKIGAGTTISFEVRR
jgi:eukaryotic-like serine/threonine-protein kinase